MKHPARVNTVLTNIREALAALEDTDVKRWDRALVVLQGFTHLLEINNDEEDAAFDAVVEEIRKIIAHHIEHELEVGAIWEIV